jgi:hypothetical protein
VRHHTPRSHAALLLCCVAQKTKGARKMLPEVNWLAVLAAALSVFLIGGAWYSPLLFFDAWRRGAGLSDAQLQQGHPAAVFGGSFVLSFVSATVFAVFLGPAPEVGFATAAGFAAGLCWVASSFGINYLFEGKSLLLFLVNGGYHTVAVYFVRADSWALALRGGNKTPVQPQRVRLPDVLRSSGDHEFQPTRPPPLL